MKTITFYSYKGGVGRSLALSDVATRLSELGQRVCVIDFDLDAPGLMFKFKKYDFPPITKGIVDYIYKFSSTGEIGNIADYAVNVAPHSPYFETLTFIAAGDILSDDYWKKLSSIRWYDLFYSNEPEGIEFFLDLKAQIEEVFNPDFLLIDSRTGITDIAGITLRILADQIAVFGINNPENLFGCKKIIKSLLNSTISLFDSPPKVNFILTRISFNKLEKGIEVPDIEKEYLIVEKIKNDFKRDLGFEDFDISVIHTDRNLEQEESRLHGSLYENQPGSVSKDYLKLFEKLTSDKLDLDEKFLKSKRAEIEYIKSINELDLASKLSLIDKAIAIDSTKDRYYIARGAVHFLIGNLAAALDDHLNALKISPSNSEIHFNLGAVYNRLHEFENALLHFEKAEGAGPQALLNKAVVYRRMNRLSDAMDSYNKVLADNPANDRALNARADLLRTLAKYEEALKDITQAIQLNPNEPVYFATLGEIYSVMGKEDEFHLNLSIALSKGLQLSNLNLAYDVYKKYVNDPKFLALINKYKIDLQDLKDEYAS